MLFLQYAGLIQDLVPRPEWHAILQGTAAAWTDMYLLM